MFEKLKKFEASKENREKVKPFEEIGLTYIDIFKKYAKSFEELCVFVEQNTAYKKYATGGSCIHRGALSPSNTDMVAGGCNRGRLLKRSPKGSFIYEYFFDKNNFPICSKKYGDIRYEKNFCYSNEFLMYYDNIVLGVCFNSRDKRIESISKCLFEKGMLIKYEYAIFPAINISGGLPELSIEIPRYENERIVSLEWQRFYPPLGLEVQEYNFSIDSAGLLSTYKVRELYGYKPEFDYGDNPPEKWVYQVFKSCKGRTHFDISKGWISRLTGDGMTPLKK